MRRHVSDLAWRPIIQSGQIRNLSQSQLSSDITICPWSLGGISVVFPPHFRPVLLFVIQCEHYSDRWSLSSHIIDSLDDGERSESFGLLTRESTLRSSKNSLEVMVRAEDQEMEECDSANNEDSGFTSIKVNY